MSADRAIRIVHVINDLHVGGAEGTLFRLLSRLDGRRFESSVISLLTPGPLGPSIERLGIPVMSLGMRRGRASPRALLRLATIIRRRRPDLVQTWLYHSDLLGLLATRLTGAGAVVWNLRCSDMDLSHYRRLSAWVVRACARLSSLPQAVVVNSTAGRVFHERLGYRAKRWELIPNGVDLERFRPDAVARSEVRAELGTDDGTALVGLVARYDPMKDHETFIAAAGSVAQRHQSVRFLLAGEEVTVENTELSRLIRSAGLEDRVHLLGRRDDVERVFNALDIAVLSSVSEGFPNIVAEAMACGVPCVVTDAGDAAEIVGDTGLVVPPEAPAALADAIERMVSLGRDVRQQRGTAARERIARSYSLERMVGAYSALYLSIGRHETIPG
jgi:glycosyltransferase involved in cell wall biosynthesis